MEQKVSETIKPAEDHGAASTYVQIRDRLAAMTEGTSRINFITSHLDDPVVVSAIIDGAAISERLERC